MEQNRKDFNLVFWIHLILIIFSYSSFIWLDWKLIIASSLILQIYYLTRGGCDLTFAEFGNDKNITFVWYYLKKIFPNINQKKTKFFVRFIIPLILILLSFILQNIYKHKALVRFF